jgi:hypothetical protein
MSRSSELANKGSAKEVARGCGGGSKQATGVHFRLPVPPYLAIGHFNSWTRPKVSSEQSRLLLLGVASDGAAEAWVKNPDNGAWTLLESGRLASLAEPVTRLAGDQSFADL